MKYIFFLFLILGLANAQTGCIFLKGYEVERVCYNGFEYLFENGKMIKTGNKCECKRINNE